MCSIWHKRTFNWSRRKRSFLHARFKIPARAVEKVVVFPPKGLRAALTLFPAVLRGAAADPKGGCRGRQTAPRPPGPTCASQGDRAGKQRARANPRPGAPRPSVHRARSGEASHARKNKPTPPPPRRPRGRGGRGGARQPDEPTSTGQEPATTQHRGGRPSRRQRPGREPRPQAGGRGDGGRAAATRDRGHEPKANIRGEWGAHGRGQRAAEGGTPYGGLQAAAGAARADTAREAAGP